MIFFLITKILMKFNAEFNWLESYLDNDSLWLEDVLNWDETFDLILKPFIYLWKRRLNLIDNIPLN